MATTMISGSHAKVAQLANLLESDVYIAWRKRLCLHVDNCYQLYPTGMQDDEEFTWALSGNDLADAMTTWRQLH